MTPAEDERRREAREREEAAREHEEAAREHEEAAREHEEAARELEEARAQEAAAEDADFADYASGGSLSGDDDEPPL